MGDISGKYRVGYWISDKKGKKLNIDEFVQSFQSTDIEFIKLNLDVPLEEQGSFDALVHKLSDVVVMADAGCRESQRQLNNVYNYLALHPNVVVIDPFENIQPILNRFTTYQLVRDFIATSAYATDFFVPAFVQIESSDLAANAVSGKLTTADIHFPVLCKPILSHGFDYAHEMRIIFEAERLHDILRTPCVLQQFVNHGAMLFKVFTVGEVCHTAVRRSIRDLEPGPFTTQHFATSDVSKDESNSALTRPLAAATATHEPDFRLLVAFTDALRRAVGLSLIGVDFIYDAASARYGVIDLNAFPGYEKFPAFYDALLAVLRTKLRAMKARSPTSTSGLSEIATNASNLSYAQQAQKSDSCDHAAVKVAGLRLSGGVDTSVSGASPTLVVTSDSDFASCSSLSASPE